MGGLTGTGGMDASGKGRGLGLADAKPVMQAIVSENFFGYSYMSRPGRGGKRPERLDEFDYAPLHACAGVAGTLPPPPIEYVDVNLCNLSLKLAGPWCALIVGQRFVKGTEPTALCDVCLPPIPPPPPKKKPWWWWLFGKNSVWAKFWRWIGGK